MTYFARWREGKRNRYHTLKDCRTQKQAEKAFARFQNQHLDGGLGLATDPDLNLAECLESYLEIKDHQCVVEHAKRLKLQEHEMLEHFGEAKLVKNLDERAALEFKKALESKGNAPPTINKKLGLLKAAMRKGVKDGKLSKSPLEGLENVSDRRTRDAWRYLKEEEVKALLGVLRDGLAGEVKRANGRDYKKKFGQSLEMWRFCLFLANTGARKGEALALRWQDVDLKRRVVCIYATKRAAHGRKAEPRYVPLNTAVAEMLEGMERKGERVFAISPNNLRRKFERACELAKIGHCRIHDLRHTFCSWLAIQGTPLNTIRELAGHASLTMTLRYAHLCPGVKAQAVEALNFGGAKRAAKVVEVGNSAG